MNFGPDSKWGSSKNRFGALCGDLLQLPSLENGRTPVGGLGSMRYHPGVPVSFLIRVRALDRWY
jgi:hypothetical protein